MTFSLAVDDPAAVRALVKLVKRIVRSEGYQLNRRKLRILRRHQQQCVTGLVVNERVNLPRRTRRRLRAVEHHLATHRDATLTEEQMQGWRAYRMMIDRPGT